jgi:hypothetical protein
MKQMSKPAPKRLETEHIRIVPWRFLAAILIAAIPLLFAGCHHAILVDTAPLDAAGMSYDSIQQAKSLNITAAEVGELAKARQGGLSDANCVKILQIFRAQGQPFTAGATVAGLIRAGIGESTVVELASLKQLGFTSGELQAMRLAGLSDETILEVARRHAAGKTVLSGASLADMKNAGLRESTLLELSRRGIPDSQAAAIVASRQRGSSDEEILKRFTGS